MLLGSTNKCCDSEMLFHPPVNFLSDLVTRTRMYFNYYFSSFEIIGRLCIFTHNVLWEWITKQGRAYWCSRIHQCDALYVCGNVIMADRTKTIDICLQLRILREVEGMRISTHFWHPSFTAPLPLISERSPQYFVGEQINKYIHDDKWTNKYTRQ